MNREEAKAYLKRKKKDSNDEEEVERCMRSGRLYGDPVCIVN